MKDMAVDKCWTDKKSGDEYRSLRIQLDHFEDHIKKEDSPLLWLPLNDMTEDELSDIAVQFYHRTKENRLLFEGLSYKGIKYNYDELLIESADRKRELKIIIQTLPELKNYQTLKITDVRDNINIDLVGAKYEGFQKTANKMLYYDDLILQEIMDEKNLFKCIGIGFTNTDYIEQYITICERICFGTLYYFIVENPNVSDKVSALKRVLENISEMERTMSEELEKAKEGYRKAADFYRDYYGASKNNAENIMMYYVQFLNRQAYYNEWEKIIEIVSNEEVEPVNPEYIQLRDCADKIDDYILEGSKLFKFSDKKSECERMMDLAREHGNYWASAKDPQGIKITLREGYIGKAKYNRHTAMSMIRNFISGYKPEMKDLMFLDMKMIRGAFREQGYIEHFDIFMQICSATRRLFLMPYRTIDDWEAYRLVHRICFEFLYIFGDTKYSKLKFE